MTDEVTTLAQLINLALSSSMQGVNTVFIAQVVSVKENPYCVDLKLPIRDTYNDEDGERQSIQLPTIPNRPVVCLHGGGGRMLFPVSVGDFGLYLTSKQSIDKWLANGGADIDPGATVPHGITDGFFLAGLQPYSRHWASHSGQQLSFGFESGSKIDIGKTDNNITLALANLTAQLKLGGSGANESVIKGDTFLTKFNTNLIVPLQALAGAGAALTALPVSDPAFVAAFNPTSVALTALGNVLTPMLALLTTLASEIVNFKSLQVKTV